MKHKCRVVSWELGQNVPFLLYNQYSAHGDSVTFGMSSAGLKAGCLRAQRLCVRGGLCSAVASVLLMVSVQAGLARIISCTNSKLWFMCIL